MLTTRRGYTWFYRSGEAPVPVFYVMHPAAALRNRFVRRWFEADIAWALTCSPPQQPPLDGEARVVRSVEDAEFACRELRAASRAAALADHDAQRASAAAVAAAVAVKRSAAVSKDELKADLIAEQGCVGKAAARLGVLPGSAYKLIRKHGLLELQQTLAKDAAEVQRAAAKEKRKQYERERQRVRGAAG